MPKLNDPIDPHEEPILYRLSQLLDWVDSKLSAFDTPVELDGSAGSSSSSSTTTSSSSTGLKRCSPPANLGTASSMRLTIRAKPLVLNDKKRGTQATTPASSPASIVRALNAIATPGKALHIVFISALESDKGKRWNEDCVLAERVIAKVVRDWTPEGQVEVVEASVLNEEWRNRAAGSETHPFRNSEQFGAVKLPLIIEWADGRAAERLRAPANADPDKVRAFFERTSARAKAALEASTAPGVVETSGVRLEAKLLPPDATEADAKGAAPLASDDAFLAEVRGGAEVED